MAFIPPLLADSARISLQIFFQTKYLLNKASAYFFSETCDKLSNTLQKDFPIFQLQFYKCKTGSFLKTTAEDLGLEHYNWDTIMVNF